MKNYTEYVRHLIGRYGPLINIIGAALAIIVSFYVLSRKRTRSEQKAITAILLFLNVLVVLISIYGLRYLNEDPLEGLLAVWISVILIDVTLLIEWKFRPLKDWQRIAIHVALLFGMMIFTLSFILSYIFPINRVTGTGLLAI